MTAKPDNEIIDSEQKDKDLHRNHNEVKPIFHEIPLAGPYFPVILEMSVLIMPNAAYVAKIANNTANKMASRPT